MIELFTNENGSWQLLARQDSDLDYLIFTNGRIFCLSKKERIKSLIQVAKLFKSELNKDILIINDNNRIFI